jgi:alkanesulfonate monooxygenase
MATDAPSLRIFSTCPQSRNIDRGGYLGRVSESARWSEAAGCTGMLVYADNGIVDPWLVSQLLVEATERLSPLVAVQPIYMHPYTVAKMVTSLGYLHGRPIYLNLLAGGFRNDLIALGDETEHDDRYVRTQEYGEVIKALLGGEGAVTHEGRYYRVHNLKLTPPLPEELRVPLMISGSSPAGLAAARALRAIAVKYPQPSSSEAPQSDPYTEPGMRIGVIARPEAPEAWRIALERFPEDRAGQIAHGLAMRVSDSHWHRQLSALAEERGAEGNPYWLGPFKNYQTFCPYLVGDAPSVATELRRYIDLGFSTFVLDIPAAEEDLWHAADAFRLAQTAHRA